MSPAPTASPPNSIIVPNDDGSVPMQGKYSDDQSTKRSWEEVGREAKGLESDIDTKLLALSRLTSAALRSGRGSSFQSDAEALIQKIESSLQELAGLIEELAGIAHTGQHGDQQLPHHSTGHLLQRHKDIHMEYVKELRKARTHLAACLQPPSTATRSEYGANDYLLREADRINHVSGIADHIIKYSNGEILQKS